MASVLSGLRECEGRVLLVLEHSIHPARTHLCFSVINDPVKQEHN